MAINMSGKGGSEAITDRMRFGIKPSAVRSSNFIKVQKASSPSGNQLLSLGNQIIFDIPNLGSGYYIDWSTSYFRFGIAMQLGDGDFDPTQVDRANNGYVRFDRGPESMFRRVEITDFGGGNPLENFENYNDLYCATELMTSNSNLRSKCGLFHGEGLLLPHNHSGSGDENTGLLDVDTVITDANPMDTNNNGFHPEIPYLRYPDLGGVVCAFRTSTECAVPATYTAGSVYDDTPTDAPIDFSRFMESTQALLPSTSAWGTSGNPASNVKYVTFQTVSSFFGGCAEKYLPMNAINGFRYVFSLDNPEGAFVVSGLGGATAKGLTVTLVEPFSDFQLCVCGPHGGSSPAQCCTRRSRWVHSYCFTDLAYLQLCDSSRGPLL
jgi:hypothetical protein